MEALFFTAAELAARGSEDIPRAFVPGTHLLYSSPATLAFHSPGAEGFGVKRAGLAVPGSVMLIVSPGCCGRNTSAISSMPGYEDRFFYLTMDQTDLVTGRHLKKIPNAVLEICRQLEEVGKKPRVVMICITCVDALLGTDMERVCRKAQETVPGVQVRPCYMYALTREGRRPPMVHVRQSIYELLQPRKKRAASVNLLGFFAPVDFPSGSELYDLLQQAGVRTVRQIGSCADYEEFQRMAEANFNLVLHPEARPAAYDLQERLGIPFIELRRFYQIDRIRAQYRALGEVLQTSFDIEKWEKEAEEAVGLFRAKYPDAVFSIGEAMNGDPFELACALVREGFAVREIFGTVSEENFVWIRLLASVSPETRIYSNLHPSMLHYLPQEGTRGFSQETVPEDQRETRQGTKTCLTASMETPPDDQQETRRETENRLTVSQEVVPDDQQDTRRDTGNHQNNDSAPAVMITIGRDAGWYHPDLPNVQWNTDRQPFGYRAVAGLFTALCSALETGSRGSYGSMVSLEKKEESQRQELQPGQEESQRQEVQDRQEESQRQELQPGQEEPQRQEAQNRQEESQQQEVQQNRGEQKQQQGEPSEDNPPHGFRRFTTPFAPDQSGAVSVLYDMGGICVVCDAGGCTGNICGFDEPRWFCAKSAVFSAGLRDMDAILGRDDLLVQKLAEAAGEIPAEFAAIIGTPVPAVIGTDYRALCRMAEKRTGLPVLGIGTDGMEYYDRGMEKAYLALLETFCRREETHTAAVHPVVPERIIGIWGYSPLDFAGILTEDALRAWSRSQGYDAMLCCGAGTDIQMLRRIPRAEKNIVLSPAGKAPAEWLEREYGIPWEYYIPDVDRSMFSLSGCGRKQKILVVHQQVLARSIADRLQENGIQADTASFFMMHDDLLRQGGTRLREEADLRTLVRERKYDVVIADRALEPVLKGLPVRLVHLPHFAVSGGPV